MKLSITVRETAGVTVLQLSGVIVFGIQTLAEQVRQLQAENKRMILLNLAQLDYVDSSGVGELITALTIMKRVGGQLKLSNAGSFLREILRITKTQNILELYDTEEEALAHFS